MTSYMSDGAIFEVGGREFEAVEDRESHYRGFRCMSCGADFKIDPSDHECDDQTATIPVVAIDPGLRAWQTIEHNPMCADLTVRRAAAVYAATQTARNPEWLTFARRHVIYERIPSSLAAMQGIDSSWADLVAACKGGWGPLMLRAVELLVYGVRP